MNVHGEVKISLVAVEIIGLDEQDGIVLSNSNY